MLRISGKKKTITRRAFVAGAGLVLYELALAGQVAAQTKVKPKRHAKAKTYPLFDEATASVIPATGYQSQIHLKTASCDW